MCSPSCSRWQIPRVIRLGKVCAPTSKAVEELTNKRAGSLKNAGYSIIDVNSTVGYVRATSATPLHRLPADTSSLPNAPIFIETNESISDNEPKVVSTVTGYWTAKNRVSATRKILQQEIDNKQKPDQR